jgi:hypothetical protein
MFCLSFLSSPIIISHKARTTRNIPFKKIITPFKDSIYYPVKRANWFEKSGKVLLGKMASKYIVTLEGFFDKCFGRHLADNVVDFAYPRLQAASAHI